MNRTTAGFLIPLGVIAYTMSGGLKATFMASYIHTAIIFVILLSFILLVYASGGDELGRAVQVDRITTYDKSAFRFRLSSSSTSSTSSTSSSTSSTSSPSSSSCSSSTTSTPPPPPPSSTSSTTSSCTSPSSSSSSTFSFLDLRAQI